MIKSKAQIEANRRWVIKNKEHVAQQAKEWRIKNPLKHKAYTKKWQQNNKKKAYNYVRKNTLKTKYNITEEDYNNLLIQQNYCCAICGNIRSEKRSLAVDHDHITGKIRGLLCVSCNMGIGYLKDDINLLVKSINYLGEESYPHV